MGVLHLKLLRELRRLWAQVVAIALVIAAGVATLIIGVGTYHSLERTRAVYYESHGFADLFAGVTRAPRSALAQIGAIDGVLTSDGRITRLASASMEGLADPVSVLLISLPDGPQPLNRLVDVLSADAVRITRGSAATIIGWGGEPLRAEVTRINPTAFSKISALGITEQRTEVVLRLIDPPDKGTRLGHGFRVVAQIVVWEGLDRVLVPLGALFRHGDAWAVFVVDTGYARLRAVTIGQRSGTFAEVVQGLEPGATVIAHPGDTVFDGAAVSILDSGE